MSLALVQSASRELNQFQSNVATVLNPILKNAISSGVILEGIDLISGTTSIPHTLGRTQQGWFLTDIDGAATVYRSSAFNNTTLVLTSSAAVTVNIYVF